MPEEINRLLTDAISDYLFTFSPDADENLKREGIPEEKIFLVGDVMIDSILFNLEKAKKTSILERLNLKSNQQPTSNNLQSTIVNPLRPH
jgi:UDP-N-acetylglucosamine 2-epimerase (non-hydrolysing)